MLRKIKKLFSREISNKYEYEILLSFLDKVTPGYGFDIRDNENRAHWPSAYALISSAESHRYYIEKNIEARERAITCASWLLNNVGCASTDAPCWGVPYPRSIWMDKSPHKPNTAFAIPTVHSIQSLCEITEFIKESEDNPLEKEQLLMAALDAASYFAKHCYDQTSKGVSFWYSPLEAHSYHVTNAISMMAGQVQRMSYFYPDVENLADQADQAVQYLLKSRIYDSEGYGWKYFGDKVPENKQNKQNDLLHDAFVCHGLLEYKKYGGRLAESIPDEELYACIKRFVRNGKLYEFPLSEENKRRRTKLARLWGIGHSLYITSQIEGTNVNKKSLSNIIFANFRNHYFKDDQLLNRPGEQIISHHVREVAHILFGLSYFHWRK
jgi:hypothetical protein